ncbi:hypothetical protein M422DRAFT_785567 [Sphaerobolus stellatus SS14]|uniref:Uncharacterized protein n=1 Tax=Sphaerobolus stellatus (strain SS14) TaxID=990650 RepID=A0A0C9UJP9_SPHS4|nr:hypothetical protein M422DRAFT_785567 [Sphaerobolus stellatus SS14]
MGDHHRSHSCRASPHKDRLLCTAEAVATILVAHLNRATLREDHARIHVLTITVNRSSSQQTRAIGDIEDVQARDVVARFLSAIQNLVRAVKVRQLLSLLAIVEIIAVMAARIRVHIRSFNVRVRGFVFRQSKPPIIVGSHRGDHSRHGSRQPKVYLEEGDRPSRGHSRSPTRVLVHSDRSPSRHSRAPVSVIQRGSGSRTPSPERAILVPRDNPCQSRALSRAHSRGPTKIDHDRGSSGRHTRPPSIYPGDPEYPDRHSAHSRPQSVFGDPDYIDQRPISAPHRPQSHAGSHRSPIDEDFADAPDSPRRRVGSYVRIHVGSRAASAYAEDDRRPLSPQRSHVTARAPSEDYADAPDLKRPSCASSRAPSRVSQVPPGRESPVHVVVPTSHRTTPPFTEGMFLVIEHNIRQSMNKIVQYIQQNMNKVVQATYSLHVGRGRSCSDDCHRPRWQLKESYTWRTSAPVLLAMPKLQQSQQRPSRTPTEIHPDHPEYDDGGGRQPSQASTALSPDHPDYDGGSRCPSWAPTVIHPEDPEYSEADGGGSRRPRRASTHRDYEVPDSRRYSRAPTVIPPKDDHLGLEAPFEDRPVWWRFHPTSECQVHQSTAGHPHPYPSVHYPSRAGSAVSGRRGASRLSPQDAPGTHPELIHTYGDGASPTRISPYSRLRFLTSRLSESL